MFDRLAQALSGTDVVADAMTLGLHDLTQLAVAVRPNAKLIVLNSGFLSPLERACIATANPGRVVFD